MFVVSTFYEVAKTIIDFQMKSQASLLPEVDFKSFVGRFGMIVNLLTFLMALFGTSKLIKKYGIQDYDFNECFKNDENIQQLYVDAIEVEKLDIIGVNQRFYIGLMSSDNTVLTGIPKYSRFQDVIRIYEIQIGN